MTTQPNTPEQPESPGERRPGTSKLIYDKAKGAIVNASTGENFISPTPDQPKVHSGFGESMYCDCGGTWVEGHEESHLEGCPLKQPPTEQAKREAWEIVLDSSRQDISHLLPGAASNVFVVSMSAAEQAVSVALSTQATELDRVNVELAAIREAANRFLDDNGWETTTDSAEEAWRKLDALLDENKMATESAESEQVKCTWTPNSRGQHLTECGYRVYDLGRVDRLDGGELRVRILFCPMCGGRIELKEKP